VDELPGTRLGRDARCRDAEHDTELADLGTREHAPVLQDHGSATPTAKV